MAVVTLTLGLVLICWLIGKGITNKNPDRSPEQEAQDNEQTAKHQAWQLLDWRM